MGYGLRSKSSYKTFDCTGGAWPKYLAVGTAFGWVPAGAAFPSNYGVVPTFESYCSNDYQEVTDHDALAFGAALELAIAAINAESPMTDRQEAALRKFEFSDDPYADAPPEIRAYIAKLEQSLPEYPLLFALSKPSEEVSISTFKEQWNWPRLLAQADSSSVEQPGWRAMHRARME